MTRIINGVAYAPDYEAIVGVDAGSGQHPVTTKVVTPGDVNFSSDDDRPAPRRRADTGAVEVQTAVAPDESRSARQPRTSSADSTDPNFDGR